MVVDDPRKQLLDHAYPDTLVMLEEPHKNIAG